MLNYINQTTVNYCTDRLITTICLSEQVKWLIWVNLTLYIHDNVTGVNWVKVKSSNQIGCNICEAHDPESGCLSVFGSLHIHHSTCSMNCAMRVR